MIDVIKNTPIEYSRQSRDYQVIARLYSAMLNISKMYADNMNVWNNDIDNRLSTLRARTVNFKTRHNWDLDDLEAVTSCFKYLMRRKGVKGALQACLYILMKIEKVTYDINEDDIEYDEKENMLTIRMEKNVLTWGVVEDLMEYLLPCGMTYRIKEELIRDFEGGPRNTELGIKTLDPEYTSEGFIVAVGWNNTNDTEPTKRVSWMAEALVDNNTWEAGGWHKNGKH